MEQGVWRVVQGPDEIAVALNATRPEVPDDAENADLILALAARTLYPDAELYAPATPNPLRPT
ncbi:MAG TPA: hypothetical protein VNJ04_17835 [Gemmatimonadaceae bacterium]|nr:hypothetical protein [Gemmatimonadaceae bacterium]